MAEAYVLDISNTTTSTRPRSAWERRLNQAMTPLARRPLKVAIGRPLSKSGCVRDRCCWRISLQVQAERNETGAVLPLPVALYRLICALGQQSLVVVLTRCGLPLPAYILADEEHSKCLTERVYLPTVVSGRVIWHLGYSDAKRVAVFTES